MASLYAIAGKYLSLVNAYDMAETDEERAEILEQLAQVDDDIDGKGENYAKIIRNLKADIDGYDTEIERLTRHRRAGKNMIERLMTILQDTMEQTGKKELKTSIGKFRLQDNPVSCEVVDWQKVPVEYRTPQPDKVDRKALIDHFKQTGELVDGVEYKRERGIRFR